MNYSTTLKRRIRPVALTITVTASRINENGTFSGFEIGSVKGPNKTFKVSAPPQGGGSLYLKVESLEGLQFMEESDTSSPAPKKKLF
jgi:hypothetical protein